MDPNPGTVGDAGSGAGGDGDGAGGSGGERWVDAVALNRLRQRGAMAVKLPGRQIALFVARDGAVHACSNRCPHEGYPLAEGALDDCGVLTCHWHNWKFDIRSGANLYGGDALRIYPARIAGDRVEVELSDPPPAERQAQLLGRFDAAMADEDRPRIARELARLEAAGAGPELALARAIAASHDRLRYGMTHAYAGADAWLRLRDLLADPAERLACATEAIGHIARDTLREPAWPYTDDERPWEAAAFLAAVEAQDETGALARLQGALAAGIGLDALEPVLAEAALAHYNDFGHSLIYLGHLRSLVARLGPGVARPLLRAWLRALVYATREDLLPDFVAYGPALAAWPAAPCTGAAPATDAAALCGLSVRHTVAALLRAAPQASPAQLLDALAEAGALQLLRFDERHAVRVDAPVADNVGWLDFSHALTFAQALRGVAGRTPALWPRGLLQLALFVGRNTPYLDAGVTAEAALSRWSPAAAAGRADAEAAGAAAGLIDHGLGLDIFPVHRVKTWLAVHDSLAAGPPESTTRALRAALNRLLAARFKQRHTLRAARQALAGVAREAG